MAIVEPRKEITLDALEVVYLNDAISAGDVAQGLPEKDAYFTCAREALILLAGAWNEVITDDEDPTIDKHATVTLAITEEMAWLFKAKVITSTVAIDNQTKLGLTLQRKINDVLLSFKASSDLEAFFADPGEINPDPAVHSLVMSADMKEKFLDFYYAKGSNDAHGSTYQGAHEITDDDAE
jgi:hypothetical protein